jgi:hypothetical protein
MEVLFGHLRFKHGTLFDVDPTTLEYITGIESFLSRLKFGKSDDLLSRG